MKPFSVELAGLFHIYKLYDADGREITNVLTAADCAESVYGCDWQSVYNGDESLDRDNYVGPTDVAFAIRRDDDSREVVAIMPGIPSTANRPDHATCYVHFGQHGACSIDDIAATHVDASRDEYADLLKELRSVVGYNVYVISLERIEDSKYADARRKELGLSENKI